MRSPRPEGFSYSFHRAGFHLQKRGRWGNLFFALLHYLLISLYEFGSTTVRPRGSQSGNTSYASHLDARRSSPESSIHL